MRAALFLIAALAACSPSAPPATSAATTTSVEAAAPPGQSISFQSPTGNIGCIYTPAGGTEIYKTPDGAAELKCDRAAPAYVRITLPEHGAATVLDHVGDAGCCGGEMVGYGQDWVAGPFTCAMNEAALVCHNAENHGFTLSREQAQAR